MSRIRPLVDFAGRKRFVPFGRDGLGEDLTIVGKVEEEVVVCAEGWREDWLVQKVGGAD